MRKMLLLAVVVGLTWARPCPAQYGWPPPNYSVTGVRAEHNYHYRGMLEILRDRGRGQRLHDRKAQRKGLPCFSATLLPPQSIPPENPVQTTTGPAE